MAIGKLLAGCSTALMVLACTASPADTSSTVVPQDVRALVAPTDTLLAYKAADLYGDGSWAAAIVVRHKTSEMSDLNFEHNPCDLLVLRRENGKLVEVDHSKKAVDCTYNDVERHAPAMSLNAYLNVSPASIVFINQKARGNSTFYFAWSKEKAVWYLRRATATNVGSGTDINDVSVTDVSASYPKNFGWIPMSFVDPDAMADILNKQAK
jgi:hypothetical protein